MDEIYGGCYPESFDLLEAAGGELCDFSPLRSEAIPDGVDVVYFGCGHPERRARAPGREPLSQAIATLLRSRRRANLCRGERTGLYLPRDGISDGRTAEMTGLLPATARWVGPTAHAEPVEVTFGASSWLAPANVSLRGYRHNGWQIEPRGPMITYAAGAEQRLDILGRGNVIGSRVLVNLAANRHLLRRFFEPYAPASVSARKID